MKTDGKDLTILAEGRMGHRLLQQKSIGCCQLPFLAITNVREQLMTPKPDLTFFR